MSTCDLSPPHGMSVSSLSHITFNVSSEKLLLACENFYSTIGFSATRRQPDGSVLFVYFYSPQALPVAIQLCLSNPGAKSNDAFSSSSVTCTFAVPDLEPLRKACLDLDGNYFTINSNQLDLIDPCGHRIAFTTITSPAISTAFDETLAKAAAESQRAFAAATGRRKSFFISLGGTKPTSIAPRVSSLAELSESSYSPISEEHMPRRVGILTSGGDSQGMNAAVRAVARKAIAEKMVPYGIRNGYQGLVDNLIEPIDWMSVHGLLGSGGTTLGTARCLEFRTEDGRLRAAHNLIKNGIDALVVIGGDGSLTGADVLRGSWSGLLEKLLKTGKISQKQKTTHSHLTIVGLVGSIDNDMSQTDMTIGCASALHRICEAVDAIGSTALSHSRAFVVEVMGRHCGWLAAMAAIATGADYLFVPERPPVADNWEEEMCSRLHNLRETGQQKIIVIVSEGAIDKNLKPIRAEYVRDILEQKIGLDARVTTLGHVQRGGNACFYDRFLATVQGVRAIDEIIISTPDTPSPMIGVNHNNITARPLVEAVKCTKEVSAAIDSKNFGLAMDLRDPEFGPAYNMFVSMSAMRNEDSLNIIENGTIKASNKKTRRQKQRQSLRIAIIHTGAPASGFNAATRAATLVALNRGHTVLGVSNGFSGLMRGEVKELRREEVLEWTAVGGSALGTNRSQPSDLGLTALQLQRFNIHSLLVIGGFEAFTAIGDLERARKMYPAFSIPMVQIPATISNNVPGTDYSLGSDTALNFIVSACDTIKQSASASRKRVFVIEVQGGNVGYLATMGGIAGGASAVYIPEIGIDLEIIQKDVEQLRARYRREAIKGQGSKGRVLLRSEAVSTTYTTDVLASILEAESEGLFDARTAVLGHMQQGGSASPLDRIRATRLAALCIEWFEDIVERHQQKRLKINLKEFENDEDIEIKTEVHQSDNNIEESKIIFDRSSKIPKNTVYTPGSDSVCVIGIREANIVFSSVSELEADTDSTLRRATKAWWMPLNDLIPMLSIYPST